MEARLFEPGTVPRHTTPEWYSTRERAPHLEQDGHRERLLLTAEFVNDALRDYDFDSVSDMGCGDGGLLSLISGWRWGYDLQPANVEAARIERGMDVAVANVLYSGVSWGELAVCTEMLEHLVDPHGFLRRSPSRAVVASSPNYETPDAHYEFHTWCWDADGYRELFEQAGFRIARSDVSTGFQIVLAVRPQEAL